MLLLLQCTDNHIQTSSTSSVYVDEPGTRLDFGLKEVDLSHFFLWSQTVFASRPTEQLSLE